MTVRISCLVTLLLRQAVRNRILSQNLEEVVSLAEELLEAVLVDALSASKFLVEQPNLETQTNKHVHRYPVEHPVENAVNQNKQAENQPVHEATAQSSRFSL